MLDDFGNASEVAIFWDYENVPVPSWCKVASEASKAIVNSVSEQGRIVDRRLYFDFSNQEQGNRWSGLDSSGFDLVNTPQRNQKETLDKKMIADVLLFCWDSATRNQSTNKGSCVVLVTSDGDYAYTLNKLRDRGVSSVVIYGHGNVADILISSADVALSLEHDVLKHLRPPLALPNGHLKNVQDKTVSRNPHWKIVNGKPAYRLDSRVVPRNPTQQSEIQATKLTFDCNDKSTTKCSEPNLKTGMTSANHAGAANKHPNIKYMASPAKYTMQRDAILLCQSLADLAVSTAIAPEQQWVSESQAGQSFQKILKICKKEKDSDGDVTQCFQNAYSLAILLGWIEEGRRGLGGQNGYIAATSSPSREKETTETFLRLTPYGIKVASKRALILPVKTTTLVPSKA
jgi:hypothetical protein